MPVTTIEIVYDSGTELRQVLYRGLIAGGGGETIDYGPVVTSDPDFDAAGYVNSQVRDQMNFNLSEQEIAAVLPV